MRLRSVGSWVAVALMLAFFVGCNNRNLGQVSMNIPEHGVGTAVENRQLAGENNRFAEGTAVWFWTRVEDGNSGETIHHVWLREGVEADRISLKLGGSSWRTYSRKTLGPESAGNWAVEARDERGRVLARREFLCVPLNIAALVPGPGGYR